MKNTIKKAVDSSNSADRFGDDDVIGLSLAKDLIAESFNSGIDQAILFLKQRGDSCNCADELQSIRNDL